MKVKTNSIMKSLIMICCRLLFIISYNIIYQKSQDKENKFTMFRHKQDALHANVVDEEVGDDGVGHVQRVQRRQVAAGAHARAPHVVHLGQELAARHAGLSRVAVYL